MRDRKANLRPLAGLHHITAVSGPPKVNYRFYTGVLGLRFVKMTVNFDDPSTYHLYYGNRSGEPGSAITFFPWKHAAQGKGRTREAVDVRFSVPVGSLEAWREHLESLDVRVSKLTTPFGERSLALHDPDLLPLRIVEDPKLSDPPSNGSAHDGSAPPEIHGFHGTTLDIPDLGRTAELLEEFGWRSAGTEGGTTRYSAPEGARIGTHVDLVVNRTPSGRFGRGSIHHIAFRVADDEHQADWADRLRQMGFNPTPVQERSYFRSIYFREPGGVLFELATDGPGFTADEPLETLGSELKLPPWYEPHRSRIEQALPDLRSDPEGETGSSAPQSGENGA